MTVQSTTSTQSYAGDGVSQEFHFYFKFEDPTHIKVRYVQPGPVYFDLALVVDYTVSAPGASGTVHTNVPVPVGTTLQIYRIVPLTQLLDYVANDQFPAEASETALDLIVEGLQQINDQITGVISGITTGIVSIVNSNVIGSVGLFDTIVGNTAHFKNLIAGLNVAIADVGDGTVRIDSLGGGSAGALLAVNNLADVADRQISLDTLLATAGAANEYVLTKDTSTGKALWKIVPTGAAGEANTASNLGGTGLYASKSGVDLRFKGLVAGANITITPGASTVTIGAAAAGEANFGQNIGISGTGIYAGKSGVNLQFKGLTASTGILQTINSTDILHAIDTSAKLTWVNNETFIGPHADPGWGALGGGPSFRDASLRVARLAPAGTAGVIQSALSITETIPNSFVGFAEWVQTIGIDDYSNGGENVGLYVAAKRNANSHIWGAVFDVSNVAGASGTGNMYGIEISVLQDSTNLAARRVLIGAFYGSRSNVLSKHTGGFLIAPFDSQAQLGYGVSVENGRVDKSFLSATAGQSALAATGSYSTAAVDLSAVTSTPIGIHLNGGAVMKFNSGAGAGGTATWFPGGFTPAFVGALRIFVDGATLYLPVCSNHP